MGQTQGAIMRAPDTVAAHTRERAKEVEKRVSERVGTLANSEFAARGSAASHKSTGKRGSVK
jgi:hypothetical protein